MELPIYKMLRRYRGVRMRFHVPGHRGNIPFLHRGAKLDITELVFSDNLLHPTGVIRRAEELFSETWGAEESYFVTSGATTGVLAALSAVKECKLLVDRYSHISAYHGIELFQIDPVLVNNRVDSSYPVLTPAEVELGFCRNPDACGLFLTYPNYYGRASDIPAISEICVRLNKLLITDASHASHFAFSDLLPDNPVPFSDVAVLSLHKTGMALTGGAAVTVTGRGKDLALKKNLSLLHSTSPSYLILSTIDFCRAYMVQYYTRRIDKLHASVRRLTANLVSTGVKVCAADDFTRLVLNVSAAGFTGAQAEKMLNDRGVYPEFADSGHVVFILSPASPVRRVNQLCRILVKLFQERGRGERRATQFSYVPERRVSYLQAAAGKSRRLPVKECVGKVSAGSIGLYPPGVPLVLAGEVITEEIAALLKSGSNAVFGAEGGIEVLDER